jgi:hypothetical protein
MNKPMVFKYVDLDQFIILNIERKNFTYLYADVRFFVRDFRRKCLYEYITSLPCIIIIDYINWSYEVHRICFEKSKIIKIPLWQIAGETHFSSSALHRCITDDFKKQKERNHKIKKILSDLQNIHPQIFELVAEYSIETTLVKN